MSDSYIGRFEWNIDLILHGLGAPFHYIVSDPHGVNSREILIVHDGIFSSNKPLSLATSATAHEFFLTGSNGDVRIPLFADGEGWRNRFQSSVRPAFLIHETAEGVYHTTAFAERITNQNGQRRFGLSRFAPRQDMIRCFQHLAQWTSDVTGGKRAYKKKFKQILAELGAPPTRGERLLSRLSLGRFGRT